MPPRVNSKSSLQQQASQQQRSKSNSSNSNSKGGGAGGGGRGGGAGGAGRGRGLKGNSTSGNSTRNRSNPNMNNSNNSGQSSLKAAAQPVMPTIQFDEVELLQTTGCGETPAEKAICRHSAAKFFSCRMNHLNEPAVSTTCTSADHSLETDAGACIWTPHEKWHWTSSSRVEAIQAEMDMFWNLAPLQVNNETRWKAKVMTTTNDAETRQEEESTEVIMGKAVAILNKLSWTTLDKLTAQFLQTITTTSPDDNLPTVSKEVVHACMALILEKASYEPHFAELYASFSSKLATAHKSFRKKLLQLCQEGFETSDTLIVKDLPEDSNKAERELEILRARKKTFGLMIFIGELYKLKLLKGVIMISCLQNLLNEQEDEDRIECFAKLLTTVGKNLQDEHIRGKEDPEMKEIWETVYSMAGRNNKKGESNGGGAAGPKAPSTRIKFLLQDLIELKENGWVQRREEEKAKTLEQIHKDVAKEEQKATASSDNRGGGGGGQRQQRVARSKSYGDGGSGGGGGGNRRQQFQQQQQQQQPQSQKQPAPQQQTVPDDDGFTQVAKPKRTSFRRSQSDNFASTGSGSVGGAPKSSLQMALAGGSSSKTSPKRPRSPKETKKVMNNNSSLSATNPSTKPLIDDDNNNEGEYLEPEECGKKAKNILKQYFVGGDTDDAALSLYELVGVGRDGDVERGAAIVQDMVLTVMEMKEPDVDKLLVVMSRCIKENKICKESFAEGLNDPLEFLRDIEIDAPLAVSLLAIIVADWLKQDALTFDFLLSAPEMFRTNGRPADFAGRVLAKRGEETLDAEVQVVTTLMTDEEKNTYESTRKFLETF